MSSGHFGSWPGVVYYSMKRKTAADEIKWVIHRMTLLTSLIHGLNAFFFSGIFVLSNWERREKWSEKRIIFTTLRHAVFDRSDGLCHWAWKHRPQSGAKGWPVSYCRLKSPHSWINSHILPAGLWVSENNWPWQLQKCLTRRMTDKVIAGPLFCYDSQSLVPYVQSVWVTLHTYKLNRNW